LNTDTAPEVHGSRRYVSNVLWTWGGTATGIIVSFLVTPYTMRKIGYSHFGVWGVTISLVEYYWLIDIGLRSATLKFSAEYRALGNKAELDRLVNTGLAYSLIAGLFVALVSLFGAPFLGSLVNISDPVFPQLARIVGISWAVGLVFNIFGACIEGFQRFDIFSRIWISTTALRSIIVVIVLSMGYGVVQMGFVLLGTQFLVYALNFVFFRRLAPDAKIDLSLASWTKFKEMAVFGVHTLRVLISDRLLRQTTPILISRFLPVEAVTYYVMPLRILDYAMDGVARVGNVTTPNATELMATGKKNRLENLGVYANRYSLAFFLPVVLMLLVYGAEFYRLWIKPDFADKSAYLLPAFLFGHVIVSSQLNSVSILFGIGRHQAYSRFLFAEAILSFFGLIIVLPRLGLLGAAWLTNLLMALNRGLITCILLCRELDVSIWRYVARIYIRPCLLGAAGYAYLLFLKRTVLPGNSWRELILAGLALMVPYAAATFAVCVSPGHQQVAVRRARLILARFGS
jgi:O-antigen/teichoic acid export membrane protein